MNAQYIIIKILSNDTDIKIAEVLAWNAANVNVSSVEMMTNISDVYGMPERIMNFHEF